MKTLYDADAFAWSEQQAAALRRLATTSGSADVDWEHVVAGIEAVGRFERDRTENAIHTVLKHAISGYCDPDSLVRAQRHVETVQSLGVMRRHLGDAMRSHLDLDRLWVGAFDAAMREVPPQILGVPPAIPQRCPFTIDDLLSADFSYDHAVERLYVLLTSYRRSADKEPTS